MAQWRGVAAVASMVLAVAGCDSGSDHRSKQPGAPPKTVDAWIADWAKAVRAGDCKRLKVIAPNFPCGIRAGYRGAHAIASASYGTGAVVDYAGVRYARPPQWSGNTQMVLVKVRGGGWIASYSVSYAKREVGTRPPPSLRAFRAAATTFNAAVAEGNCSVAFDYTVAGQPRETYCKKVVASKALDHQLIAGNPPLRLEAIGGTANIQFFRSVLRAPKRVDPKGRAMYATVSVVRMSRMAQAHGASNPYLVAAADPAPTPADVAVEGPYTKPVRAGYVKSCVAESESSAQCGCRIEMIAAAVPYPDFRARTDRFDRALADIDTACREGDRAGSTRDEKRVAQMALAANLVPGYICSPDSSTDLVILLAGGSRFACGKDRRATPPDDTATITHVNVTGDEATVKGTDTQGRFRISLVRQGPRWLVDDFESNA